MDTARRFAELLCVVSLAAGCGGIAIGPTLSDGDVSVDPGPPVGEPSAAPDAGTAPSAPAPSAAPGVPTVTRPSVAAACSTPAGHMISYSAEAELEQLILGDWMRCSGQGYPAEYGVGIRISADRSWNALELDQSGNLVPIDTGFFGHGTWTIADCLQFILHSVNCGAGYFPAFTDTGWLLLDPGGVPTEYARIASDR